MVGTMENEGSVKQQVLDRFVQFLESFGSCCKMAGTEPALRKCLLPMGVWKGQPPIIVWNVEGRPALLRLYSLVSVHPVNEPIEALDGALAIVASRIKEALPKGSLLRWYFWEPAWRQGSTAWQLRLEAYGVTTAPGGSKSPNLE
jgi:hypothetical protein